MTITRKRASRSPVTWSTSRAGALALAMLMGISAFAASVDADAGKMDRLMWLTQASPAVSADQAAAAVRAASGGRILDVRLDNRSQPPIYRVKVLLDRGRVRIYRVDASTGRVLE